MKSGTSRLQILAGIICLVLFSLIILVGGDKEKAVSLEYHYLTIWTRRMTIESIYIPLPILEYAKEHPNTTIIWSLPITAEQYQNAIKMCN